MNSKHLTVEEWSQALGREIRDTRILLQLDQRSLARLANVSLGALAGLERAEGSSLTTLIAVVRALGRTDWLETLAPVITVSPMQMLRAKSRTTPTRVRRVSSFRAGA